MGPEQQMARPAGAEKEKARTDPPGDKAGRIRNPLAHPSAPTSKKSRQKKPVSGGRGDI